MSHKKVVWGVIGGSGLYQMKQLKVVREHRVTTPFGRPSDAIVEAETAGKRVFFLPRHGKGHRYTPSEVNYCANIYALKLFGVTHCLAVSAVGIMKESIKPGDIVIPDQIFDRTFGLRRNSFFGEGVVGHVSVADPFCPEMNAWIEKSAQDCGVSVHRGGIYVCIEGPQFSTRAESHFYRSTLAPSVIGMTAVPEAKLAREAEMCYGMVALATDYDCWNEHEDDVSVEAVLAVVKSNVEKARSIAANLISQSPETSHSEILSSAKSAIMTDRELIPLRTRQKLSLFYGRYFA